MFANFFNLVGISGPSYPRICLRATWFRCCAWSSSSVSSIIPIRRTSLFLCDHSWVIHWLLCATFDQLSHSSIGWLNWAAPRGIQESPYLHYLQLCVAIRKRVSLSHFSRLEAHRRLCATDHAVWLFAANHHQQSVAPAGIFVSLLYLHWRARSLGRVCPRVAYLAVARCPLILYR